MWDDGSTVTQAERAWRAPPDAPLGPLDVSARARWLSSVSERRQPSQDRGPAASPSGFSATRTDVPEAARVVLRGALDLATAPLAEYELRQAQADARHVLLDLSGLTFIDAAGLRVVLAADRRARAAGGRLVVACNGSPCVRRLFDLTGARAQLELSDAAAAAEQNGAGPHRT